MSDTTQDAGAGQNEAGGTQQADASQATAGEVAKTGEQGAAQQTQDKAPEAKVDDVAFEVKAPEGVELDQTSLDEFTKIVKDKALSPSERAQKLVDLAVKREADRAQAFAETVQSWADTVAADKELGNPENQAAARKIVEDFGTPEFKSLLNSTGMGNHPEVVRFVMKIGKALSEDAVIKARGTPPSGASRDLASVLYGNKTP